jgi:hypothetical protein
LGKNINFISIYGEITKGYFEIKRFKDKYSSVDLESNRLFIGGIPIKTKNTIVNYDCPICDKEYSILLKKFLLKKTLFCSSCKEKDHEKRKKQSDYLKDTYSKFGKIRSIKKEKDKISDINLIDLSNHLFEKESREFKNNYYQNHLNLDQFNKIKSHIHSVNEKSIDNLEYLEHIKNNNQMKYSSYLYDRINNTFLNFNSIRYICESCDSIFNTTRSPIERLSNFKFLCKKCYFCNNKFKIRSTKNCLDDKITYQSNPELDLINFCNSKNIIILNGPKIEYTFMNKTRNYFVDYYIPSKKMIIEIKDSHIWHKNQIESGQWELKEKSAIEYSIEKGLEYKLIFSQYLKEFLKAF